MAAVSKTFHFSNIRCDENCRHCSGKDCQKSDKRRDNMANFREMRDILTINDEEFVLLYVFSSKNLSPPYKDYQRFSFDDMDPDECKTDFRFCKNDIPLLADVLRNPGYLVCSQRTICGGIEGLCILLRRLAYPCRYSDLIQRYPWWFKCY